MHGGALVHAGMQPRASGWLSLPDANGACASRPNYLFGTGSRTCTTVDCRTVGFILQKLLHALPVPIVRPYTITTDLQLRQETAGPIRVASGLSCCPRMLMMTSNLPRSPLRRCSLPQLTRAHAFSSVTRPKIWERTPPVRWCGALPCQVGLLGVQGGAARTRSVLAVDVVPAARTRRCSIACWEVLTATRTWTANTTRGTA